MIYECFLHILLYIALSILLLAINLLCNYIKFIYIIIDVIWSGWPDLNRRPLHPQCSALPGCATSRNCCYYIL